MTKKLALLAAGALAASVALPMQASAELEELQVHGQVRIRGNYLDPGFGQRGVPALLLPGIIPSAPVGFDDDGPADDFYNALVEVNFTADMSDDVSGYIALRSFDIWGSGVRGTDGDDSTALTDNFFRGFPGAGAGGAVIPVAPAFGGLEYGAGNDPVGVYQAYIQMDNVGGYPVSVRIGRQEISLGREYLVGNADGGVDFAGHAFDALRVTYDNDETFRVTAFTAKLTENRNIEEDPDVDFRGIYGTYYGLEMLDIDAYWLWWDNGIGAPVLSGGAAAPGFVVPTGDESENIHTLGVRAYGEAMDNRLRWNAEFAYQFGDTNETLWSQPLNGSLDVDAWTLNALVGYTFDDVQYRPEVHAEYAFFSGDDDLTDDESERFVRLFSDVHYGKINLGGFFDEQTTNMHILRLGGSAEATETLTVHGDLLFFWLDEDDIRAGLFTPAAGVGGNTFGLPQVGTGDDEVGVELDLWATWRYTEDLILAAGWSHFFADDAIDNSFGEDDDLDYLWWQAHLVF